MFSSILRSFFLPIFSRHKKIFLFLIGDGIVTGLFSVFLPLLLKLETDQLMEKNSLSIFSKELTPFLVFAGILLIILLAEITTRLITRIAGIFLDAEREALKNRIQLELFRKMNDMEVGKTLSSRFRKMSRVLESEFSDFSSTLLQFPREAIERTIQVFGITAIFVYFDIRFLFIVIVSSIISYFIDKYADTLRQKYDIHWKFSLGQKAWYYSDLFFRSFPDLATNGAVRSTLLSYEGLLDREVKRGIRKNWAELSWTVANLFTSSISQMLIKLIVGMSVFAGTQSIGIVALVVASMGTVEEIMRSLFQLRRGYVRFRFQEASLLLFLEMCHGVGTKRRSEKSFTTVTIENLSFSYPNLTEYEMRYLRLVEDFLKGGKTGSRWIDEGFDDLIKAIEEDVGRKMPEILSSISMTFERGKIYGIVGKNGAGKTTLVELLGGFFRNYSGNIHFGDEDIETWMPELLAKHISFLTQEPFFMGYGSTVRDNLFLGVETPDEGKAQEYLTTFGLAEKIEKSPKKLDSELGDDIEFSGGERQILTFIRLLLQDRPIIILDEGTNQLDAENELLVMSELLKEKENKIIIFITHRMSTISRADMIYCIENQKVIAQGNHQSLLESGENPYARFYQAQVLHGNIIHP